jgi:hypothetical protein
MVSEFGTDAAMETPHEGIFSRANSRRAVWRRHTARWFSAKLS